MTVLLYAVTEAQAPIEGAGLDQRPLRAISESDLTAVVSDHPTAPPPTEWNLWAYEHVVETLMTRTPVLPARFGATAATDADIKSMLQTRQEEFRRTIERVRGAIEIAIRVPPPRVERAETAASGTEYMQARLAQRQLARQLATKIEAAVGSFARARTRRTSNANTLAYLVDADQIDEFVAHLDQLNDPDITWTGPWPPYSFTETQPAGEAR